MTDRDEITFCFVGDMTTDREKPETMLRHIAPVLNAADLVFGQLESNLSERGSLQVHAGNGARVHPRNVKSYVSAGFDVLGFASNHTLDWGFDALEDTIKNVTQNGIAIIGAGKNIDEARKPAIFERKGTKFGFLTYCSMIPAGYEATPNRPGLAPIRVHTIYEPREYQPGVEPRTLTFADKEDLEVMRADIAKLRSQVDILVFSHHGGLHFVPAVIPMYQKEITHAAIDAGADIVLGHHAHILKGIEVYKGKAIFYGLCNFGIEIYGAQTHHGVAGLWKLYNVEFDPEYTTYPFPKDSQKTVLGKCIISKNKIKKVSFFPVHHNKNAEPELVPATDKKHKEIVDYMKWITKDQGLDTKFTLEGDEVIISI